MKFIQRPVVVEAEQFFPDRLPWPKAVLGLERSCGDLVCVNETKADCWGVQGYEGWHLIKSGDWVVTDVFGQHWVYGAKGFPLKFAPASELVIEHSDGANIQPEQTDPRKDGYTGKFALPMEKRGGGDRHA